MTAFNDVRISKVSYYMDQNWSLSVRFLMYSGLWALKHSYIKIVFNLVNFTGNEDTANVINIQTGNSVNEIDF